MSQAGTLATNGGGGGGDLLSLTPDSGGAQFPDFSGTIFISGGTGVSTLGTTSTVIINTDAALQSTTVVVTSAQLKTLTTPLIVLPAPGPNLSYQISFISLYVPFSTTPYGNTSVSDLNFLNSLTMASGSFIYIVGLVNSGTFNGSIQGLLSSSSNTFIPFVPGISNATGNTLINIVNQPIWLFNSSLSDLTGGDSDLHIQFLYRLITTPF